MTSWHSNCAASQHVLSLLLIITVFVTISTIFCLMLNPVALPSHFSGLPEEPFEDLFVRFKFGISVPDSLAWVLHLINNLMDICGLGEADQYEKCPEGNSVQWE